MPQQAYSTIDGSVPSRRKALAVAGAGVLLLVVGLSFNLPDALRGALDPEAEEDMMVKGELSGDVWVAPEAAKRCDWIAGVYEKQDALLSTKDRHTKYKAQGKDANSFYRATANLFWHDFVNGGWGEFDLLRLAGPLKDGSPLQRTSTWTWVTGDQHLSNFGAFHARDGDVVYGLNDFDEAVIYDFQVDVWRVAVSIYNHALTNGLSPAKAESAVETFCDAYVNVVRNYIGNDNEQLFEIKASTTPKKTALHEFLKKLQSKDEDKAVLKFTERTSEEGLRFVKTKENSLEELDGDIEDAIREGFVEEGYPATLPKVAWHAIESSGGTFEVLDVARRVGSGIGSFGVDRFYVLLAGEKRPVAADDDAYDASDRAKEEDKQERRAVILDVKEEPSPAARDAFEGTSESTGDAAWFDHLFKNQAARAVKAQRAITSLTDPYAGWAKIDGRDFVVRERSPYKGSFDLDTLDTFKDFGEYVEQIAAATATSHVRASVGEAPARFKEVIDAALGTSYARMTWADSVARVAKEYREQVLLDYECFYDYANATVGPI